MPRSLAGVVAAFLVLASASIARAASFDPAYRFRTLSTSHFIIYFHQGEDGLALRLAAIAEELWSSPQRPLGVAPPPLTHVVLVDQTDLANGLATPIPYNTIVITATWPAGSEFIGKTTDWLRTVFTHEFTHIVHLDRSEGWARGFRYVLGRHPIVFPNLFLPQWQIEGLATYEESRTDNEGRLHAGDFRQIVDEAARTRRLEPLDRVNGGLTAWPDGSGAYAYGAGFHEYLAARFGQAQLAALANATAGRFPFTGSRSFLHIFGESLGSLWNDYQQSELDVAPNADGDEARRLTHHGFDVSGPRFDRFVCSGCPERIVYSVQTPQGFPSLYQLSLNDSRPERLAERYQGSTAGIGPDRVYFDQQEVQRSAGLYSDLYVLARNAGTVQRLTNGARLIDPDLSPDGHALVCVQARPGRRDLVLVTLDRAVQSAGQNGLTIETLVSEGDTQFNAPRWSPDGRSIVVERHAPGLQSALAIVDVATHSIRTLASNPGARFVTPTWRPDGRTVVFAADFSDGPFQLYELDLAAVGTVSAGDAPRLRQLTSGPEGATWPDFSPDGRTLVFVGYTTDGFDLFSTPYRSTSDLAASVPAITAATSQTATMSTDAAPRSAPYNPLRTLFPTFWSPIVSGDRTELRVGLTTSGGDVLGYHGYTVSGTWLVSSPEGAILPPAARPDWQASYQYTRWQPTFWIAASSQTSFYAGAANNEGVPTAATLQERQVEAGVLFPMRRVRTSQTTLFSLVRSVDDLQQPDALETTRRVAVRAGWGFNSARTYGYSVSQEGGFTVGATTEVTSQALGSSGDATTVTADGRMYLPIGSHHHVLAVRLAGGFSSGDAEAQRTFVLGGAQPNLATIDFGRSAISLLRGFPSDSFAGTHVALLNADYRWPLVWPERGHGTWPLFLRSLHAAVFADAGETWTRQFDGNGLKVSAGGELSVDIVAGYFSPFSATLGAAWGHDDGRTTSGGGSVYVRLGRAF